MSSVRKADSGETKGRARAGRDSLKGSFVGNYELLQTIGEGSFAKVKLAKHRITHQKVAIKVIDKTKLPDEYAVKNMYREAQILRMLDHPNIIKLFEVMETKRNLFFILEYASGGEFLEYIISNGKLPEEDAKRFTKQIISAIDHAHSLNIVHRDLKAENFLLDDQLNIKLSDFGLSNFFDNSKLLGTFCGSPVYSAPELIEGKKYIGPEVDAWSLGINVFAMVAGDLPFADSNLANLYDSIIKGKYTIPEFVSNECRDLISKLLMVNPKKRAKVAQLLEHPWLSGNIAFLDSMDEERAVTFRPQNEQQMDTEILQAMEERLGMDKKLIVQGVLTGKFNQAAGMYYLLTHQKKFGKEEIKLSSLSLVNLKKEADHDKDPKDFSEELANVMFQVERTQHASATPPDTNKPPEQNHLRRQSTNRRAAVTERKASHSQAHNTGQHAGHSILPTIQLESSQVVALPPINGAAPNGAAPIEHHLLRAPLGGGNTSSKNSSTHSAIVPITGGAESKKQNGTLSAETKKGDHGGDHKAVIIPHNRRESTKFGLTNHSNISKKIPVDESIYQLDEQGEKNAPRTIKYAFNCFCHTKVHPALFFEKLYSVLDKNDVQWYNDEYLCSCDWGDIKFEVEICKLPRQAACGLRIQRIAGDIWEFKKLSSKITGDLEVVS